jgi:hypothetical protein
LRVIIESNRKGGWGEEQRQIIRNREANDNTKAAQVGRPL